MEKRIEDYLHLYLGCDVESTGGKRGKLIWTSYQDTACVVYENDDPRGRVGYKNYFKPILRPLSDMTEDEKVEFEATKVFVLATPVHHVGNMQWTPETFRWLLSKQFDLFGLIESGLAINIKDVADKTTLKD
jgi:hypothetical protein